VRNISTTLPQKATDYSKAH